VSLSYPDRGQPALHDISLTVRPGEHVVLTGPSGAGKSSLLALLLRFAAPSGGTITAGGADLAQISADRWRAQIAWVPQQPHLFAATVADNIALGQPGTRRRDIAAAARLAGADDFIRQLPCGYDTLLTEGARSLSAGQRQKIALARAFLRQAPVLLLDEPTAHLDPASADAVMAVLATRMADRTVILVTHRPPPRAGRAARILALDQGRLSGSEYPSGMPGQRAGLAAVP
jgi:ATP-binding cassette, subfamily C, bacterial CydD